MCHSLCASFWSHSPGQRHSQPFILLYIHPIPHSHPFATNTSHTSFIIWAHTMHVYEWARMTLNDGHITTTGQHTSAHFGTLRHTSAHFSTHSAHIQTHSAELQMHLTRMLPYAAVTVCCESRVLRSMWQPAYLYWMLHEMNASHSECFWMRENAVTAVWNTEWMWWVL